jgi:signal peptidase II
MSGLVAERRLELLIVIGVAVLDQVTKMLVRNALALHESVEVVPDLLSLTRVHNTGAAFGMLNGVEFAFKAVVMSVVALLALGGVGWYAASVPLSDVLARAGIASVVGGAIGNLIDRATAGYVLDFVDAYWSGWHFWAFNVADSAISVGAALVILDGLLSGKTGRKA